MWGSPHLPEGPGAPKPCGHWSAESLTSLEELYCQTRPLEVGAVLGQ